LSGDFFGTEERLAGATIEEEAIGGFGALGDSFDFLAINLHFADDGRTGSVMVPQVVMNRLEMPEALAGAGVQGEGAVGKKVVAFSISAPEIGGNRAGTAEEDAVFRVERKSTPRIGGAALFP